MGVESVGEEGRNFMLAYYSVKRGKRKAAHEHAIRRRKGGKVKTAAIFSNISGGGRKKVLDGIDFEERQSRSPDELYEGSI